MTPREGTMNMTPARKANGMRQNETVIATGGGLTFRWRDDGALFSIEGAIRDKGDARTVWDFSAEDAGYNGTAVQLTPEEGAILAALGIPEPSLIN
jgi:hypothetical protein